MELLGIGQNKSVVSSTINKTYLLFFPVFISPSGHMAAHPLFSPDISLINRGTYMMCRAILENISTLICR